MKILLSTLLFCWTIALQAQTILTYGDSLVPEKGIVSYQMPDATIWVVGTANIGIFGGTDITVMKIDTLGNVLSPIQYFGSPNDDSPNNMIFQNGQFIVVGEVHDANGVDGFVLIFNHLGLFRGFTIYGQSNQSEQFASVEPTPDGGFIVAGFGATLTSNGSDFLISKFDNQYNQEWIRFHDLGSSEMGMAALVNPSGGYLMTGDKLQSWPGFNVAIAGCDADGFLLWDTIIPYPYNGGCKGAAVIGNEIVIMGEIATPTSSAFDIYLARVDWQGNTLWQSTIPKTNKGDAAFDIWVKNNNSFYITGYVYTDSISTTDLFVMELDTIGNILQEKHYPSQGFQMGYDFKPSIGGGYFLTGFTNYPETQILVVIDHFSTPTTALNNLQQDKVLEANIFPNPTQDKVYFPASFLNYKIEVFDSFGRFCLRSENSQDISLANLENGLYIFVFTNAKGQMVARQKIFKM